MSTEKVNLDVMKITEEPRVDMQYIMDLLFSKIYPLIVRIRNRIKSFDKDIYNDAITKFHDVYSLCGNQIKKIILNLLDVFKIEHQHQLFLHEGRQFALERLSWCINRLSTLEQQLEKSDIFDILNQEQNEDSIFVTPMYFVNWIDHTFEVLVNLADIIYRTDYKDNNELYGQWKSDLVECVTGLHTCVDELLLSAMTLCRHCLPTDQHVVKARCQVVLRETKALLTELVQENPDATFKVTADTLNLPIMPSNVNILIDVLKDVLYVLETNTNTALLALVVHCFSDSRSPVDVLRDHFQSGKGCSVVCDEDKPEDCSMVKEFDLYNERLLQIGSFAVSCSSDQTRILSLRSGLSSLEALDAHLVPAVMLTPNSHHAVLLTNTWKTEVEQIKDNVFLIVDPAAFAEKSKQMMHQILLEVLNEKTYNNTNVCAVINIGCVVYDFFCVYNKYEPEALTHSEKLVPLLADLNKVQTECKIVSNILTTDGDFVYDIKQTKNNKNASLDQLVKRLKLLYTLVTRINDLLRPKQNDNQLFDELCDEEPIINNNLTRTIFPVNTNTYINSPRKLVDNISRSIFARTSNIRSSTNNFPLSKLTKHFKAKRGKDFEELSFSVKLDELDISDDKTNVANSIAIGNVTHVAERSMFFGINSPMKSRSSLRRAVLCKLPSIRPQIVANNVSERESLMDETMSLQITDVLNEISDLTTYMMPASQSPQKITRKISNDTQQTIKKEDCELNVLTLNINTQNSTISKHIWNIPVNANTVECLEDSALTPNTSNMTQPSNVTTLERINDLNLVESKLSSLRSMQFETTL